MNQVGAFLSGLRYQNPSRAYRPGGLTGPVDPGVIEAGEEWRCEQDSKEPVGKFRLRPESAQFFRLAKTATCPP